MPIIEHDGEQFVLSHSEEEKLNEFQQITSFPSAELKHVIQLLRNHSWQLEAALGRYFDGNWKENLDQTSTADVAEPVQTSIENSRYQSHGTPIGNTERLSGFEPYAHGLIPSLPTIHKLSNNYREKLNVVGLGQSSEAVKNSFLVAVLFLPNLIVKLGVHLISWLGILFSYALGWNLAASKNAYVFQVPSKPDLERKPDDSLEDVRQACGEKADDLLPLISKKSFNELYDSCESEYKFLLMVFMGPISDTPDADPNSKAFVEHILAHKTTISLLKKYDGKVDLYVRSIYDPECWTIAKHLNLRYSLECLLVANVMNRGKSMSATQQMSVVSHLKVKSLSRFQNSLKSAIERYLPELVVSQTEKEELATARKIKEMQDEAYHESVRRDTEKQLERERQEEGQRRNSVLKSQKQELKKISILCSQLNLMIHGLKKCTPLEVQTSVKMANIQIRTADGRRIIEKYSTDATLRQIYTDVAAHLYLDIHGQFDEPNTVQRVTQRLLKTGDESLLSGRLACRTTLDEETLANISKDQLIDILEKELLEYEGIVDTKSPRFDFELVSAFPRTNIPNDASITIQSRPEIWPNGSLLVEALEEEEEEEEEDEEDEKEEEVEKQ